MNWTNTVDGMEIIDSVIIRSKALSTNRYKDEQAVIVDILRTTPGSAKRKRYRTSIVYFCPHEIEVTTEELKGLRIHEAIELITSRKKKYMKVCDLLTNTQRGIP